MILTENHSNLTNMVLMVSHNLREAICNRSSLDWSLTSHESLCGFSGESFRHFMNNMGRIPDLNYLEVGSYCGSTLFSFLFNNLDNINKAYAVDNWSQFNDVGDPKSSFFKNRDLFFPNGIDQLEVIEHDCFTLDLSKIKEKINFYFYDGPHSEDDHYNAYMYYNDVLDDEFITVIDDWNSNSVKRGTSRAFKELGYEIIASFDIDTTDLGGWSDHPDVNWWRGAYIAVIKKGRVKTVQP